jgi:hypothetical protein
MNSNEELIHQRQMRDDRTFMITSLDPAKAPRVAPATTALRELLVGSPHGVPWSEALATMLRASDIAVKTADNVLRKSVASGLVRRVGEYAHKRRGPGVDSRMLYLIEWPTSEEK